MRLLVCGGRDYADNQTLCEALGILHRKRTITLLIEGGAQGADRLARMWAISNDVPFATEKADWQHYGKAAGPIRNAAMLAKHAPDAVVAFPGRTGTADMVKKAEDAKVNVWYVGEHIISRSPVAQLSNTG